MSSLRQRLPHDPPTVASARSIDPADGRVLRRERNVEAVRTAVLDALLDGAEPTLAEIAQRAGVATRSVYRYFGDVDTAIEDAIQSCRSRAIEVFESEPTISENAPLDERVAMLVLRRIRLDRVVAPVSERVEMADFQAWLDTEVLAAFAPELIAAEDDQLSTLLCGMFRLRAVRAMRDVFNDEDQLIAPALMRAASALLTPFAATVS
ncbi:MAG: TetR family transcriptional regulator [Ilumatobacter sp.]